MTALQLGAARGSKTLHDSDLLSSAQLEAGTALDGVQELVPEHGPARIVGQLEQVEAGGGGG